MLSDDDLPANVNSLYESKDHSMKEEEELLLSDKDGTYYHDKPEDRYNAVYIIFFVLGVGSLLPWNFFITAKHYWLYKLRNISNPEEPESASDLSRLLTTDPVQCNPDSWIIEDKLTVILCYTGQAMGGTMSAIASVVDLAAASDIKTSALIYFLTADLFVVICIIIYLLLPKLEYSRYYIKRAEYKLLSASHGNGNSSEEESHLRSSTHSAARRVPKSPTVPPLLPILSKTYVLGFSVFYVFFISIIVFPSISSNIDSMHRYSGNIWSSKYFAPLTSFLLYNFADWCGRQMTAWVQVPGPQSKFLPILVLSRTVFIPLFMLCNYQPRNYINTVVFKSDLYPILFTCALGLSNGYLGTLAMIYGPKVIEQELAEATGVVMSFFLTLGLAVGSAFSILIVHFI
ncbi:equilibrative nucleoside transporter 3 [Protopterus annectens]|uniref:equilibrative nucleoside transporter 3 n=1 Tax=Protopterus annectens TaxID=7888 RepID=UPI001CFC05F4|nr:equilibrative nucleoside transporter 3 [Protopterus annectens]